MSLYLSQGGESVPVLPPFEILPLGEAELRYFPCWYSSARATALFATLQRETPWRQDSLNFGGRKVPVPRLQAWYGDAASHYGYSNLRLSPLPWTDTLAALRLELETSLGLRFNSVLLNYYRDGTDSVAWHSDDEKELGPDPSIASLSLGPARRFELRLKQAGGRSSRPRRMFLEDGSLLLMGPGVQRYWQHRIPKEPGITAPRLNLTFRFIHPMA